MTDLATDITRGRVAEKLVCVAAIATAHGVRGALKLRCFTEDPASVAAYGPVCDERGHELFSLRVLRTMPGGAIVEAGGISDRNAAEALRGMRLYVPRARLPEPDDADEFYHEDLIGLAAFDPTGRILGRVKAVFDFGAGDVLEIVPPADGEASETLVLPFTRAVVPAVDLAAGRLTVILPAEIVAPDQGAGS